MVEAGITDILLTYNVIGQIKLDRLVALAHRADIKVVADCAEVVEGLSSAMSRAGLTLQVLVECDTGALRSGVTTPTQAVEVAQAIDCAPGVAFRGLMTYPPKNSVAKTNAWLAEAVDLCKRSGLSADIVSNGGTPDLYTAHEVSAATEHRPGTYIYSDRYLVETHAFGTLDDCALRIHATVASHASADRCILDAGSKSLSSDLLGLQGHDRIVEHPDWEIFGLSEEHGHVRVPPGAAAAKAGERVTAGSMRRGKGGSRTSTTCLLEEKCNESADPRQYGSSLAQLGFILLGTPKAMANCAPFFRTGSLVFFSREGPRRPEGRYAYSPACIAAVDEEYAARHVACGLAGQE